MSVLIGFAESGVCPDGVIRLGIRHLLVGSGRFLSVVNDPDDISAPGLTVTDLDGRRLIPGFID